MVTKLYNLKRMQTDQKVLEKAQIAMRIEAFDAEILMTETQRITTSVNRTGAISDFAILQIHKDTMSAHIVKLQTVKKALNKKIDKLNEEIIELLKETEQYKYLVEEEKKLKVIEQLKKEEEATNEYMQSKYFAS
ncbi:MAG: hypothetical protein ACNI3C_05730 [Candidatus Marinarcus sp.]|uniref:hypothetical protein n=1 Tax=Candidatus Marinarcus sp. TaxID=3100987 RepID=UPI003B000B2C